MAATPDTAGVSPIYRNAVTITHDQIKALAAGYDVQLVPAPGAGKRLVLLQAIVDADISGGAYTNIDADAFMGVKLSYSGYISTYIVNDSGTSTTYMNSFLGNVSDVKTATLTPLFEKFVSGYGPFAYVSFVVENEPLTLSFNNGSSGALRGGHADNTIKVLTLYTIADV